MNLFTSCTACREGKSHDSQWRDDKTLFLFIFRDEYLTTKDPSTDQGRKSVLANVFADVGWECPQILAAMQDAGEIYFDRVCQIRMDCWIKGRTALIGDAAVCVDHLFTVLFTSV
jgi:2-polyprenyl-6-methoxyphenol hydroxylase-like FAD-dependent oxidoreductase